MENGANVNLKDVDGNTPVAIAAAFHADGSIPILIPFRTDLNIVNNLGESPLNQATKWGHIEVCKLLLENYSPDPFISNDVGYDCFEAALFYGHYELSLYYLEKLKKKVEADDIYFDKLVICLLSI